MKERVGKENYNKRAGDSKHTKLMEKKITFDAT